MQIQREAVSDYVNKTATSTFRRNSLTSRSAQASLQRGKVGTFLLVHGGVLQAANFYTFFYGNFYTIDQSISAALPGTLPL